MGAAEAERIMQDANLIVEDIPAGKSILYLVIFFFEIAVCFGIGMLI